MFGVRKTSRIPRVFCYGHSLCRDATTLRCRPIPRLLVIDPRFTGTLTGFPAQSEDLLKHINVLEIYLLARFSLPERLKAGQHTLIHIEILQSPTKRLLMLAQSGFPLTSHEYLSIETPRMFWEDLKDNA
ncbi:hypothetical protein Tco_0146204 [Tanacetum coccineum]